MKHLRYFLSFCFSMIAVITMADNIVVDNISMLAGEEKQIVINLNNTERNYVSCQFDIVVPQDFSLLNDGIEINEERCNSHQFNFVQVSDNRYRLMIFSMPVKPFVGTSGPLVYLRLHCNSNVLADNYTISFESLKFTDESGKKHVFNNMSSTVSVKSISIKANSYHRKYGEENPTFNYTSDYDINGEPELLCEATKGSPVGTYPIKILKGTVTDSNVILVDGELIIEESPLTIIADNKQMIQGESFPEFTATYEGFKNDETESVLNKLPQFTCDATESSSPGNYIIGVSSAETINYSIKYVDGTLTIVEPQAIVVTVNNISRLYGDPNPDVYEYTVEGGTLIGEPVIYCSATQDSPVGVYDIFIEKGSVSNYNVSFVNGTLTVEKAELSIKADNKEMFIGEPLPEFTATFQGFRNGESQIALTKVPKFECNATSNSAGGNYPITVYGADAQNYNITYENGLLSIIDPPLTVTATSCEREYGEENPTFSFTVEGGKLIGNPILKTVAIKESHVGNYRITIEQGNVINENVTYVEGILTVKKAPLEIKANDITIHQGEAMPQFTANYRGFKLADNELSLQELPKFTCEATNSSQIGEFAINVSGAESKDYDISYVKGVLNVVEAHIIVKANDKIRLYGEDNPIFDYTIEGGVLEGTPIVRCEASKTSAVGEYEIIIEKGTVTNNDVTFLNGQLRIDKTPLTITAENKEIILGEEIPEFTAIYEGFKNGETPFNLEQAPRFSCTATQNSDPGDYVIEVSGAQSSNYDINYVNGSLIIKYPEPEIANISNPVGGQLAYQIENAGFSAMKVNEMTVTGLLNGTDIKCIREMIIKGSLTVLDIQGTSIISGGEPYYGEGLLEQRTEDNVVGQFMFMGCKKLISIQLPKTVKLIEFAFEDCDNLLRLDIPESCIEVGINAVSSCPSLTTITIPSSTRTFNSYNCTFCPSLKTIDVDSNNKWLTSVDGVLYSGDMSTLIKYPMGKQETSFDTPENVIIISDYAFFNALLTKICLPNGLLSIGCSAFQNCNNIVEMELPQSVVTIDMSAFDNCGSLNSIILPDGLTEIADFLANYCKNLSYLRLPNNITKIGFASFAFCESLSRIDCYIPEITSVLFDTDYFTEKVNAFEGIPDNCTWHVLSGTKEKYLEQSWWVNSWNIVDDLSISGIASPIFIKDDHYKTWYTIEGKQLSEKPSLPGLYIHNGKKVMVR